MRRTVRRRRPLDDRDGVLQDVHWYAGSIGGAFQCYTLGNIIGAQLYEAALRERPGIPEQIAMRWRLEPSSLAWTEALG